MSFPIGLSLKENAISDETSKALIKFINKQKWTPTPFKREVQQYGHQYNYKTRGILANDYIPIPKILTDLADELKLPTPDNIIINKYEPGEGISPHTDSPIFGDTIASLSLLSSVIMDLKRNDVEHGILLNPKSLLTLTSDARYNWTHGIVPRKSDYYRYQGRPEMSVDKKHMRSLRISITFRTIT
jgi:alkylated DNA repair dioxygenase AlkB